MRGNLIKQLNHWGVERWLGLTDSAAMFSTDRLLVQTTSLLRYPFVNDKNYRGAPDMMEHPLLNKHLLNYFVSEVAELTNAVFLGLGPKVQNILDRLIISGVLKKDRIIGGMLHPSGNNTYRLSYLAGDRTGPTPHATNPAPYDDGRRAFRSRFLSL